LTLEHFNITPAQTDSLKEIAFLIEDTDFSLLAAIVVDGEGQVFRLYPVLADKRAAQKLIMTLMD
tara:strand:+ start:297 stop:491 length:195 start_codon:yes stop_codon:yes gene_type:complete